MAPSDVQVELKIADVLYLMEEIKEQALLEVGDQMAIQAQLLTAVDTGFKQASIYVRSAHASSYGNAVSSAEAIAAVEHTRQGHLLPEADLEDATVIVAYAADYATHNEFHGPQSLGPALNIVSSGFADGIVTQVAHELNPD